MLLTLSLMLHNAPIINRIIKCAMDNPRENPHIILTFYYCERVLNDVILMPKPSIVTAIAISPTIHPAYTTKLTLYIDRQNTPTNEQIISIEPNSVRDTPYALKHLHRVVHSAFSFCSLVIASLWAYLIVCSLSASFCDDVAHEYSLVSVFISSLHACAAHFS